MSRPTTTPERDACDLAGFGYRQKLDRTLGSFSAFAASFSYLSVLTGSSQLFHMGYAAGGPAFFWTWPAVFAGQFLVALCFAELAARYPLSGGVYQWSKLVGGGSLGWMAGWVFLACAVITLAATALALQTTLPQLAPWFQFVGRPDDRLSAARNAVLLGVGLVGFTTLINAFGVRLLARINNVGVVVELTAALGLIGLLAWHARRGPAVVFDAQGHGDGTPLGFATGPALAASLMAMFVLYGFDTAGSLAEETDNPRRRAPRAILLALASVGVAGSLLVFTAIRAVPDLHDPALAVGSGGLPYVVKSVLGPALGLPFLAAVALAIMVCTLTVHAAAVRLVFAMARDNHLPFARALARVSKGTLTPALPAVLIGIAGIGLLAFNANFPHVIEDLASVAVVWANLAYLFVTVPLLHRRIVGWPDDVATPAGPGFSLGRWGLAVNVAAVAWGVLVVINTGWPRPEVYGDGWLGRTGAAVPTATMITAGLLYDRLVRRRRTAGVIAEHRVDVPAPPSDLNLVPHDGNPPAPERKPRRLRVRLRPRRLTRPRR